MTSNVKALKGTEAKNDLIGSSPVHHPMQGQMDSDQQMASKDHQYLELN